MDLSTKRDWAAYAKRDRHSALVSSVLPFKDTSLCNQQLHLLCVFAIIGLKLAEHLYSSLVICIPRYVKLFLTAIPSIEATEHFLIDSSSHLLIFKCNPEASEKGRGILNATGICEESYKNKAALSTNWLIRIVL